MSSVVEEINEKTCPNCEKSFIPNRYWQIFCSKNCKTSSYKKNVKKETLFLNIGGLPLSYKGDTEKLLNLLDSLIMLNAELVEERTPSEEEKDCMEEVYKKTLEFLFPDKNLGHLDAFIVIGLLYQVLKVR